MDGRGLLVRQAESQDPYLVLDLLQCYVAGLDLSLKAKTQAYTAVRSFFMHNRCALPDDRGFKIRASRPGITPRLSLDHVASIARGANLRDRSIVLVKWQAMLDNERTVYVGKHLAEQVVSQIKAGACPVRLDIPRRKENEQAWYTFIGKDAVEALRDYFEKERGWPKTGEPIWLKKTWNGKAEELTVTSFNFMWLRLIRRIGLIPKKKGDLNTRYGYNAHEMRDIAKSLLHTHALKDGFDIYCSEFWLGHEIDKNRYDKFYQDREYIRKQYLIAEKYLNIISQPLDAEHQEELTTLRDRMAKMEQTITILQNSITSGKKQVESIR